MKKPLALAAALSLSATLFVSTPAQAKDSACNVKTYMPKSVTVGTSPVVSPDFKVTASNCTLTSWSVTGDTFFVWEGSPAYTFRPTSNSEAGPQDLVVAATNADYNTREKVYADGFTLKRQTKFDRITRTATRISGRLLVADWDRDKFVPHKDRTVTVEWKSSTGTVTRIKNARTDSTGTVSVAVPRKTGGQYHLRYAGTARMASASR